MQEVWKRMIYDGIDYGDYYLVSNIGRIKGVKSGLIRKETINKKGYCVVNVSFGARENKRTIRIHRAVAETFIPKIKGKDFVNHIDCNKQNNNIENLEWCTALENTNHAVQNNLMVYHSSPVKCLETGEVFDSIKLAAEWCKCKYGTIVDYLCRKDKNRNYAGRHPETNEKLHWCYLN